MRRTLASTVIVLAALGAARAQSPRRAPPPRPAPTVADFVYGQDSERQRLDFWQARSERPTPVALLIHGGGWKGGDKTDFGDADIQPLLNAGISVVALDYRFIAQAMAQNVEPPVKACVLDAARALQTVRSKAAEWRLDPSRIGATGVSAGACTSLWLAFHDDLADPRSSDPIARESTRLTCAAGRAPQTSLDPKELREWMPNAIYGGHAFGFAAPGRTRAQEFELLLPNREQVLPWIKEYSPIELATRDDPPVYMEYARQTTPPIPGRNEPDPTHSALMGVKLAEKLGALGVEAVVAYPGHQDAKYGTIEGFLIVKLGAR
jgi:acetyl esterase/lipase